MSQLGLCCEYKTLHDETSYDHLHHCYTDRTEMRYRLDLKLPHIQTTFIRAMSQLTSLPQTPSNSLPPLYKMRHAASDLSKEGDLGPHETALVDALNALHECSVSLHLFVVLFISFDCSMRGSRVTHVMHVNASSADVSLRSPHSAKLPRCVGNVKERRKWRFRSVGGNTPVRPFSTIPRGNST